MLLPMQKYCTQLCNSTKQGCSKFRKYFQLQFYQALAIFNKKPSLIVCCSKLNVLLENGVKDKQGHYEGVYTFQGYINERDSWIDAEGENAIWYIPDWKDWAIGSADKVGTKYRHMRTTNDLEATVPAQILRQS